VAVVPVVMFEDVFEACRDAAVDGGAEGWLERMLLLWLCIDAEVEE
jgi:hypothetical protein